VTGAPAARAEAASHKRDAQQDEAGPARTRMLQAVTSLGPPRAWGHGQAHLRRRHVPPLGSRRRRLAYVSSSPPQPLLLLPPQPACLPTRPPARRRSRAQ